MIPHLPADFKPYIPTDTDYKLASICLGWTLGFGYWTALKAVRQTKQIWRRTHDWKNLYIWLVWGELLNTLFLAIFFYLSVVGIMAIGFVMLLLIILSWVIQTNAIPQIILNRISLIVVNKRHIFRVKILVLALVCSINILVGVIWIPATMQLSGQWRRINEVEDRFEKAWLAAIDVCLNVFFIYLVRTKLTAGGLTKYYRLFWFNVAIIFVALSLDFVVIGMMSMSDSLMYLSFQPIAYMAKLNIETTMADTIAAISSSQIHEGDSSQQLHSVKSATAERNWRGSSNPSCHCRVVSNRRNAWISIDGETAPPGGRGVALCKTSEESIRRDFPGIKKTTSTSVTFEGKALSGDESA